MDTDNFDHLISPDDLAKARSEFAARALRRGREAAEEAVSRRPDLEGDVREAWIDSYAKAYAGEYIKGALEERARIAGIMQSPEAAGREGEALRLAMGTRLQPAEAAFFLASPGEQEALVREASGTRADQVSRLVLSSGLSGRA